MCKSSFSWMLNDCVETPCLTVKYICWLFGRRVWWIFVGYSVDEYGEFLFTWLIFFDNSLVVKSMNSITLCEENLTNLRNY